VSAAPSSDQSKQTAPSSSSSASVQANSAVTNSDDMDGFFNTKGAPGRAFAPRPNPADPGQALGELAPASTAPASATSDAAMAAEQFVKAVKAEEDGAASSSTSALVGSKRSHAAISTNDEFDDDEETMPFAPVDDEAEQHMVKKAKQS
jgi:hypothetical protein